MFICMHCLLLLTAQKLTSLPYQPNQALSRITAMIRGVCTLALSVSFSLYLYLSLSATYPLLYPLPTLSHSHLPPVCLLPSFPSPALHLLSLSPSLFLTNSQMR
jgi:hypothetical protein